MNTTTLTELCELLERLIPLLQEGVVTLQQDASGQGPLIQRLLHREIQERETLIRQLQAAVTQFGSEHNEPWTQRATLVAGTANVFGSEHNKPWTEERFQEELLSTAGDRELYESQNQIEKLCHFGVDLMNLVHSEGWQLEPKFRKYYFALYFQNSPVFGVYLRGQRFALQVWFQTDVRAESNNLVLDHPYKCTFRDSDNRGKYNLEVTVENIKDVLEFAYLAHVNQNTS